MTREIKFRAWLPDMGHMIYSDDPDSMNEADAYFGFESGTVEVFTIESGDDDTEYYSEEYNDAILMQFTGLHDKNGKEIYEGDIVRAMEFSDQQTVPYGGGYVHMPLFEMPVTSAIEFAVDKCSYVMAERGMSPVEGESYEGIEVIGNIHENPELLEE